MNAERRSDRVLNAATMAYAAAFVLHNADHARRGVDASPQPVVWAGTVVAMLTAVIVTLVFTGHPSAPRAAAAGGAAITAGVSFAHLAPVTSVVTDPLTAQGVSVFSWIAVLAEIATALMLAIAGWRAMQQSRHEHLHEHQMSNQGLT